LEGLLTAEELDLPEKVKMTKSQYSSLTNQEGALELIFQVISLKMNEK